MKKIIFVILLFTTFINLSSAVNLRVNFLPRLEHTIMYRNTVELCDNKIALQCNEKYPELRDWDRGKHLFQDENWRAKVLSVVNNEVCQAEGSKECTRLAVIDEKAIYEYALDVGDFTKEQINQFKENLKLEVDAMNMLYAMKNLHQTMLDSEEISGYYEMNYQYYSTKKVRRISCSVCDAKAAAHREYDRNQKFIHEPVRDKEPEQMIADITKIKRSVKPHTRNTDKSTLAIAQAYLREFNKKLDQDTYKAEIVIFADYASRFPLKGIEAFTNKKQYRLKVVNKKTGYVLYVSPASNNGESDSKSILDDGNGLSLNEYEDCFLNQLVLDEAEKLKEIASERNIGSDKNKLKLRLLAFEARGAAMACSNGSESILRPVRQTHYQ